MEIYLSDGSRFRPLDPGAFASLPAEKLLTEIANALSRICRFGGRVARFISVAEHSIHVYYKYASWWPEDYSGQLLALLHDASEAFLGDIVTPLKKLLPAFWAMEQKVNWGILNVLVPMGYQRAEGCIKSCDEEVLGLEVRRFLVYQSFTLAEDLSSDYWKTEFIRIYNHIYNQLVAKIEGTKP